jgi:hypothetical protein
VISVAWLASRKALLVAGTSAAVTLTGAGGFLSGTAQVAPAPPAQVRVVPRETIREIAPVIITQTAVTVAPAAPGPVTAATIPAATVPAPAPAPAATPAPAPCTLPPGLCKTRRHRK